MDKAGFPMPQCPLLGDLGSGIFQIANWLPRIGRRKEVLHFEQKALQWKECVYIVFMYFFLHDHD